MVGEEEKERSPSLTMRGRAALVALLVVVVAIAAWLGWVFLLSPDARIARAERALGEAVRVGRSTELRLTGIEYAPVRDERVSGRPDDELADLRERARAITTEHPSADAHHTLGRVLVASGRPMEALGALRAASALNPQDPEILVDLAVAQAEVGDLTGALAVIEKAIRLEPGRADAVFNRALIEAKLGNSGAARDDFNRYLAIDPGSRWAEEARERLRNLNPRLSSALRRDGSARADGGRARDRRHGAVASARICVVNGAALSPSVV